MLPCIGDTEQNYRMAIEITAKYYYCLKNQYKTLLEDQ